MNTSNNKSLYLIEDPRFQQMPGMIQSWILQSHNAIDDFAEFFRKGGTIESAKNIGLPYYAPLDPPKIFVDKEYWHFAKDSGPKSIQFHIFGTLVHEIGHDRYNTGSVLFRGGSAEDYVRYRSELEAQGIFNAFSIFKDLEDHPDFRKEFPYSSIGYLQSGNLKPLYDGWRQGQIDEAAVIARIADKVPNAEYTLPAPLADHSGDGKLTHRDLYLRDYKEMILRQPQMAVPQPSLSETTSRPLSTTEADPILARLAELQREMDALRRQMQHHSPSPHDGSYPSHETDLHADARSAAMGGPSRDRFERESEFEPPQHHPQRDAQTFPTHHRDYALFEVIRRQLPPEYSDDMAARATLEAKLGGITRPDQIRGMAIEDGRLTVMGKTGLDFAVVELTASAPPLSETLQQSAAFDHQQAIQLAQFQEQQRLINARGGPAMTL